MPIVDIELVGASGSEFHALSADAVAGAVGEALGSADGHTWVRLRHLASSAYAENGCVLAETELPVFVTVLHARPPTGAALSAEIAALTLAVARCVRRSAERVHVLYAPAGEGRLAFGGRLV